ncbi:MAG: hypothetical protein K0Q72_3306, partial [Armatimonadetes bacterium]|nr:hypothetical protein [Armatimonadota bacterium]
YLKAPRPAWSAVFRFPHLPVLLAAVLLSPGVARAQGGGESLAGDTRLDRPVTLRLGKSPLSRVLAEVGKQSGVALTPAPEVADEPAIVFVREQPAREVLRHLALLFRYTWTRTASSDPPRYRLFQDLRSRREEEALWEADRLQALARLRASLGKRAELSRLPEDTLLRLAERYDDHRARIRPLTPEQLQLPEFDLMRRAGSAGPVRELAGPHWRALTHFAVSLAPPQWEALASGKTLWFSTRDERTCLPLPAQTTRDLRAARPSLFAPGRRLRFADAESEANVRRMEERVAAQWQRALAYRVRVRLRLTGQPGQRRAELELVPSTVMPPDFMGEQQLAPGPLKVSSEETPAASTPARVEVPGKKDPALEVRKLWKRTPPGDASGDWENRVLVRIAETYPINLIADAYRHPPVRLDPFPTEEERSLREVLDRQIAPLSGWDRQGAFLRVRRRTWFLDRMAEIPERVADTWEVRFRKDPVAMLDDLSRLAVTLRDAQLEQFPLVMRERGIRIEDPEVHLDAAHVSFLRLYGSLTPAQRQALRTGARIPFWRMPAEAQRHLQAIFDEGAENAPEPPPFAGAPPAELSAPRVAATWIATEDGATLELRMEDPALLLPSEATQPFAALPLNPRSVTLLRQRQPLTNVAFRYYSGGAIRYFYVLPLVVTVRPRSDEPVSAPPAPNSGRDP